MPDALRSILAFAIVLGPLIVFHELGHAIVARLLGFPVAVFSVGFGKRLWGFNWKGTDVRLSAIPLGGYVRIVGLGPDEQSLTEEGKEELLAHPPAPTSRWARVAIFSAGPIANAILAVIVLAGSYMLGREVPAWLDQPAVAAHVAPGSPAEAAGLVAGDEVIGIEGKSIASWDQYQMEVMTSGGRTLTFRVERGGKTLEMPVAVAKSGPADVGQTGLLPFVPVRIVDVVADSPAQAAGLRPGDVLEAIEGEKLSPFKEVPSILSSRADLPTRLAVRRNGEPMELTVVPKKSGDRAVIGVQLRFEEMSMRRLPFVGALAESIRMNVDMTKKTLDIVGRLFRAKAPIKQMSGPLEIAKFAGQESKQGLSSLLAFMAMISLQLFIFNALPIPLLDGFHIVLIALEGLRRRDFSLEVKERIFQVGFVLLVALMLVVIYHDVLKSVPGLKKLFGG